MSSLCIQSEVFTCCFCLCINYSWNYSSVHRRCAFCTAFIIYNWNIICITSKLTLSASKCIFFLLSPVVTWFPVRCSLFVSLLVSLHDYHKRFNGQRSLSTSTFVLNKKCWDRCQQVGSDQLFYKKQLTSPPPTRTACFPVDRLSRNSLPLIWNNSVKTKIEK